MNCIDKNLIKKMPQIEMKSVSDLKKSKENQI